VPVLFSAETIPDDWREGLIVPLYKIDSRLDTANYRGITLLSVVSKFYTSLIAVRLGVFLGLDEEQGAFRRGRGCTDQLFCMLEVLRLRARKGLATFCAFLDVKKAYDGCSALACSPSCLRWVFRERCGECSAICTTG